HLLSIRILIAANPWFHGVAIDPTGDWRRLRQSGGRITAWDASVRSKGFRRRGDDPLFARAGGDTGDRRFSNCGWLLTTTRVGCAPAAHAGCADSPSRCKRIAREGSSRPVGTPSQGAGAGE